MPSPAAAGVPAATVFAFPSGFSGPWEAAAVLAMVIVPALLMVSTIRFRSFKTLDLQARRSSPVLFLLALVLAALAAQPEIVLLALAYAYLASAFIELAWTRWRRRPEAPPAASTRRTRRRTRRRVERSRIRIGRRDCTEQRLRTFAGR